MSTALSQNSDISSEPSNYATPSFPSLYWPFPLYGNQAYFLYEISDIWRFTLLWTLIFYAAMHIATSGFAVIIHWRSWKIIWTVPVLYAFVGGIEALMAGSIVGGLLSAVYRGGGFRMSTWIPFVWALINSLVLILSSYAIQGGL